MLNASEVRLCKRNRSGRFTHSCLAFAAISASFGFLHTPAAAQDRGAPTQERASGAVCNIFAAELDKVQPNRERPSKDQSKQLFALCPGRALTLGPVTDFMAVSNETLRATLIDAQIAGERQVLLLTLQDDGPPLVENLNGQIARAAGRGPMSEIDGIALDLKQFAHSGEFGVVGRPEDRARARADKVALAPQVVAERTRRAAQSSQN